MASLHFNGDVLDAVNFNGDDLEEVYFNGDLVFQKNASSQLPIITSQGAYLYAVDEGEHTYVYLITEDPTGNGLTYQWYTDIGTFDDSTYASPQWTAPADAGGQVAHIYCDVTNTAGTVTSDIISISVIEVPLFLCSVTNPSESHLVSANGVVMGLQVEDTLEDGHIVYRRLRYYAYDHNTGSGGYASGAILMDWNNDINGVWANGSSTVYVNGYAFGLTTSNGKIKAVSGGLIDSGAGVNLKDPCGLEGFTSKFGLGHGIYLYTDAAGRFRLRYYFDSANDNYTKWFTPEQVEF